MSDVDSLPYPERDEKGPRFKRVQVQCHTGGIPEEYPKFLGEKEVSYDDVLNKRVIVRDLERKLEDCLLYTSPSPRD